MIRFIARLNLTGWLLLVVTVPATFAFIAALNTWYGGSNAFGWPWHLPNQQPWTRTDYYLIPLFALIFFWGVAYSLSRMGIEIFRADPSPEEVNPEEKKVSRQEKKRKKRRRSSRR